MSARPRPQGPPPPTARELLELIDPRHGYCTVVSKEVALNTMTALLDCSCGHQLAVAIGSPRFEQAGMDPDRFVKALRNVPEKASLRS